MDAGEAVAVCLVAVANVIAWIAFIDWLRGSPPPHSTVKDMWLILWRAE